MALSGNYFSRVNSGRLRLVELPEAYVFNVGVSWELDNWQVKFDLLNASDERYFRARTGDTLGDHTGVCDAGPALAAHAAHAILMFSRNGVRARCVAGGVCLCPLRLK